MGGEWCPQSFTAGEKLRLINAADAALASGERDLASRSLRRGARTAQLLPGRPP